MLSIPNTCLLLQLIYFNCVAFNQSITWAFFFFYFYFFVLSDHVYLQVIEKAFHGSDSVWGIALGSYIVMHS